MARWLLPRLLLVATISLGVLAMHGFVVADHGMASHTSSAVMANESTASATSITGPRLTMAGHAGEICVWILVAGITVAATLLARRHRRTDLVEAARSVLRVGQALPGPAPPVPQRLEMLGVLLR